MVQFYLIEKTGQRQGSTPVNKMLLSLFFLGKIMALIKEAKHAKTSLRDL